jgi:RNA polymerase sigma factor (sigma-70 family)
MHTTRIESWLELHRKNDPQARDELINHSCERLRRLARKILRESYGDLKGWEQTDDVVQKVVMKLHKSLAEVQPESVEHFFNLATMQIRQTLVDLCRHYNGPQGRAANHHTDGSAADLPGGSLTNHFAKPETREEWLMMLETVEQLPEESREIVNLYFYQDLSHLEIAELLDITDRTSKRRWRAAKEQLQKLIIEQADE